MNLLWIFIVMMVLALAVWYLMGKGQKPGAGQKPPSETPQMPQPPQPPQV